MEGSLCFDPSSGCDRSGKVQPVTEYDHSLGCAVTGGYVYRGTQYPDLEGYYFYGDFCSGRLFSLYKDPVNGWKSDQILDTPYQISTFGEDEQGELYLADYASGKIYKLKYASLDSDSAGVFRPSNGIIYLKNSNTTVPLQKGATFLKPSQNLTGRAELGDPAQSLMTDFSLVTAYKVNPLENLEAGRGKMIHYGVRMLFVVDDHNHILGLVTATDLTGEKPMQIIQAQGIQHTDVLVKDIMTPREKLEVLCMDDVVKSAVGHVVATLQKQGRQHALVAERRNDRSQVLRGMLSASQISRQLGIAVHTLPVAQTIAERAFRGRNILSKEGRLWYERAAKELMAQGARKMLGPVIIDVELAAPTRRSYDPDNKIKALFDSLVKSAIIEDDSNLIVKRYSVSVDGIGFQGARITLRCCDAQPDSQEGHSRA